MHAARSSLCIWPPILTSSQRIDLPPEQFVWLLQGGKRNRHRRERPHAQRVAQGAGAPVLRPATARSLYKLSLKGCFTIGIKLRPAFCTCLVCDPATVTLNPWVRACYRTDPATNAECQHMRFIATQGLSKALTPPPPPLPVAAGLPPSRRRWRRRQRSCGRQHSTP